MSGSEDVGSGTPTTPGMYDLKPPSDLVSSVLRRSQDSVSKFILVAESLDKKAPSAGKQSGSKTMVEKMDPDESLGLGTALNQINETFGPPGVPNPERATSSVKAVVEALEKVTSAPADNTLYPSADRASSQAELDARIMATEAILRASYADIKLQRGFSYSPLANGLSTLPVVMNAYNESVDLVNQAKTSPEIGGDESKITASFQTLRNDIIARTSR